MRLDRLLANNGVGSRREIKALIKRAELYQGQRLLRDAGEDLVWPLTEPIFWKGERLNLRCSLHLMMNKPGGYITALNDPKLPCVSELLPRPLYHSELVPVGRLDRDTEGLLLWTTSGQLAHRLCQPKWEIEKHYRFYYKGPAWTAADVEAFAQGIKLADGSQFRPCRLQILEAGEADLFLTEGRFHEVKRLVLSRGREVTGLKRLAFGPLSLDPALQAGEARELTAVELEALATVCELAHDELSV